MMLPRVRLRFRQAVIIALGLIAIYYFRFGALPTPTLPLDLVRYAQSERRPRPYLIIAAGGINGRTDCPYRGTANGPKSAALKTSLRDAYAEFSVLLIELLHDNKPPVVSLTRIGSAGVIGFLDNQNASLKRPDLVYVGTSETGLMRKAHQDLIEQATNISIPCISGTRGIVSTAGGSHLPVFIISLRMLRRTGSSLPVELFLRSDDEYDQYLCEELLPALNARCIILEEILKATKRGKSLMLEKFQYKIFSVLFSSFEDVLLLDADNFPVKAPEYVFDSELYRMSGLVTWPDFWISTASERFFDIQGTIIPPTNVRASTESGQVFVNKRTHASALLVATYYNYYGPSHYYSLLTQGGPGEGDKETFLAGATAVGAPFYQVSTPVAILGYVEHDKLNGVAMLQHDPVDDYNGLENPAPFTIHANFPKMDPNTLFGAESPVIDSWTGKHHRLWGNKTSIISTFGRDVELTMWEEIRHVSCDFGGIFKDWKAVPSHSKWKGTCELVEDHMDHVFPLGDE